MNNITCTIVMTGILSAAIACGQSPEKMTVRIPFAFRVGSVTEPAGAYEAQFVNASTNTRVLRLTNLATGEKRIAMSNGPVIQLLPAPKDSSPRIVFRCAAENDCALAEVWPGNQASGARFTSAPRQGSGPDRLATIQLRTVHAD